MPKRVMMRTKLHLHCTHFWGIIFKVRKAHEASITHCWATRQIFRGELILVKRGRKTPDNNT